MIIFNRLKSKFGLFRITVLELLFAFALGILIAILTRPTYSVNADYIDTLAYMDLAHIDKLQLLFFIIQYRVKEYLLIWLFSITVLAVPYNTLFVLYKGFISGFVVGVLAVLYGYQGVLYGLGLATPHYLVYIIVLLQTVTLSYKMHERVTSGIYNKRGRLFLNQLPSFLVLLSMTIIGCFIETFWNPPILAYLKNALGIH